MFTFFVGKRDGKSYLRVCSSKEQRDALFDEAAREGWSVTGGELPRNPLVERLAFGNRE
ncbi:MAG TPA: hypothetical protein VN814_12655 [Caulobacteraceae bacterium]|nr:hypothetical protein [Caulobacteraceae bacterium]